MEMLEMYIIAHAGDSQVALAVKNLSANAGDIKDAGFNSWVRKIP